MEVTIETLANALEASTKELNAATAAQLEAAAVILRYRALYGPLPPVDADKAA